VSELIQRDNIHRSDALRLVALFSLRFEHMTNNNGTRGLLNILRNRGWEEEARLVQVLVTGDLQSQPCFAPSHKLGENHAEILLPCICIFFTREIKQNWKTFEIFGEEFSLSVFQILIQFAPIPVYGSSNCSITGIG
jgi:hypothetical protein